MTTEKPAGDAAQLMRQLDSRAPEINRLATDLSERISRFEDWLAEVPGRVETHWGTEAPSGDPELTLCFRFHRSGKRWIISFDYDAPWADPSRTNWRPLTTEGSVEEKLAAVETFDDVLKKMVEAQDRLADRLRKAHERIDRVAEAFNAAKKGGA